MLQTIFWSPEIRLCDTPGLVFPSLTTYELQALSTILPIAHIPALPAVIRLTACLMPLETILDLVKVVDAQALERERKKTYRLGTIRDTDAPKVESWTTGEILQGWAEERGYSTYCPIFSRPQSCDADWTPAATCSDRPSGTTRPQSSRQPKYDPRQSVFHPLSLVADHLNLV